MKRSDIDIRIIEELNNGKRESKTLVEALCVDFQILFSSLKICGLSENEKRLLSEGGITQRMQSAGALINTHANWNDPNLLSHTSDTIRGWCAYALANNPKISLSKKLDEIKVFAADPHFGVREWAWLAMRPFCLSDLEQILEQLGAFVKDSDPFIRRFASELTRPRGVWCGHIPLLKESPEKAHHLLTPLRNDPSRYVQDSVANWLNDASKTAAPWVIDICSTWLTETTSSSTQYICRRGQRSLKKNEA